MKFLALSRTGFAVALSAVMAAMVSSAKADEPVDNIFSKVSSSFRDRVFFRLNYVYANVKTTSGNTYDVTGPVFSSSDYKKYLAPGNPNGYTTQYFKNSSIYGSFGVGAQLFGSQFINGAVPADVALGYTNESAGLGTPDGIKAKSQDSVSTPAVSVGYFFTDDYTWFVEGYLLASPINVNVQGAGVNGYGLPNGINGVNIIQTRMLPPTAVLGYYFGKQSDKIRPYVGVGASYAVFFDTRPTDGLNNYVGGNTSISIKNAFGVGPFMGLRSAIDETWHMNLSVGQLRYKTDATLVTSHTKITSDSGVIKDYGPNVTNVNTTGAQAFDPQTKDPSMKAVTAIMCDLAASKFHNNNCDLGTYVRGQNTVLDATMFMFSVGRSF